VEKKNKNKKAESAEDQVKILVAALGRVAASLDRQ
jgi:hypothetical protein